MSVDVDWADMPPEVRAWYMEQMAKQEEADRAAILLEQERGQWVLRRNPMTQEPLTREDGSVVYKDPVIFDEPLPPDPKRAAFMKRQLGLE